MTTTLPEIERKLNELYEWAASKEVQRLLYHGPETIKQLGEMDRELLGLIKMAADVITRHQIILEEMYELIEKYRESYIRHDANLRGRVRKLEGKEWHLMPSEEENDLFDE